MKNYLIVMTIVVAFNSKGNLKFVTDNVDNANVNTNADAKTSK